MRGSIIVYSSTQKARQEYALDIIGGELDQKLNWNYLANFPDIKLIEPLEDKKSIGIAHVKEGIVFMQEKPLSLPIKILLINKADWLTTEAQNALLKTLEEPPEYALILLLSKTENSLLPTVISRCRKMKTKPQTEEESGLKQEWTFKYILNLNLGQRIDWAEETAKEDKDTIIDMLEEWVEEGRHLMLAGGAANIAENIELIIKTLGDLENTNVGVRLALEQLLISLG